MSDTIAAANKNPYFLTPIARFVVIADDAAVVAHSQEHLQTLMDHFSQACQDFSLVISLNKTKTMGQGTENPPSITINNYTLEAEADREGMGQWKAHYTYKGAGVQSLRILGVTWKDMVTHTAILERAQLPSMYSLLRQRRLRWLGLVCRMDDGHIPKDILFAELSSGKRQKGRPQLRYKDVCKQDLKSFNISLDNWEVTAQDRLKWQKALHTGLLNYENTLAKHHETKRIKRKQQQVSSSPLPSSGVAHTCDICGRVCASRIGLLSHRRRCVKT
ncbi:hypothetical protein D4764_08G0003570 [Takifugu flavidus]|uniref:Uncharacterized protein n=1 Tax=Takifugu flavidus TaxID=433684 RepID=A0A5C6MSA5_9TELE|nr:hypothetical protein D4764_08G0003570 [Takifugu flavidus]